MSAGSCGITTAWTKRQEGIDGPRLYRITAAGKWGLYQGSDRDRYLSCHMADLLHGYGAPLIFGGIWRGPEYRPEINTMERWKSR